MSDAVLVRYNQVLEKLDLDGCPMSEYDALDIVSLIIDLERAFNIQISNNKANELFKQGSHKAWMDYIRTLL